MPNYHIPRATLGKLDSAHRRGLLTSRQRSAYLRKYRKAGAEYRARLDYHVHQCWLSGFTHWLDRMPQDPKPNNQTTFCRMS